MEEQLVEHRKYLVEGEHKSQEQYDKTVLSLSGGALAVSFAFVKDYLSGKEAIGLEFLLAAWIAWGLSSTITLASFYTSVLAFRKSISQVDKETVYKSRVGGRASIVTDILNAAAGLLFLAGVVTAALFAAFNLR